MHNFGPKLENLNVANSICIKHFDIFPLLYWNANLTQFLKPHSISYHKISGTTFYQPLYSNTNLVPLKKP